MNPYYQCTVVAGTHAGKSGTVRDINLSKTRYLTIAVVQKKGNRFKTLGRNVRAQPDNKTRNRLRRKHTRRASGEKAQS